MVWVPPPPVRGISALKKKKNQKAIEILKQNNEAWKGITASTKYLSP